MKRNIVPLALMAGALLSVASCKDGKPTMKLAKQATREMFDNYRAELADSVLDMVDVLAGQYFDNIENGSLTIETALTAREKLVRPKYLFSPNDIDKLVTMHQKTAALAFLITERPLRIAYGMSLKETDAAIARLVADMNYPLTVEDLQSRSISDNIRAVYAVCKEKRQVRYFWEVQTDALINLSYLIASAPELYNGRITDEQVAAHIKVLDSVIGVLDRIASVDMEMARVREDLMHNDLLKEKRESVFTASELIEFHVANRNRMIARRNRLLR